MPDIPPALDFRVEIWTPDDDHVEEILAACSNQPIARAAFDKAAATRSHQIVRLRLRARVIKEHLPNK